MTSLRPYVGDADRKIFGDLSLYVQVPGLNIGWAAAVSWNDNHSVAAILSIRCKWSEIGEKVWYGVVDLERTTVGGSNSLPIEEPQAVLVGKRPFFQGLIENAVPTAKHRFIINAIREAYPRPEGLCVDILRTFLTVATRPTAKVGVRSENAASAGVWQIRVNG